MPLPNPPQKPPYQAPLLGTQQLGANADQTSMRGFQSGQPIYGYTHPTPQGPAPSGYSYDPVKGQYTPVTQSPGFQQEEAQRRRRFEDIQAQQEQGSYERRNRYQDQALESLRNITGGGGGYGGGGNFMPPPNVTTPNIPQTPGVTYNPNATASGGQTTMDAATAAQNAAFGRAKATAGSLGQSAMQGLQAQMANRGIMGSGVEGRGIADILAGATNPLSDINAAGLHENVGISQHNQDLAQQANLAAYQGGITQRGQTIGENEANANRQFQTATGN